MSRFRVEKARAFATLTLSNGATVEGCLFISETSPSHDGPERAKDVLNGSSGFFPFEVTTDGPSYTALYHRDHVVAITIRDQSEPQREPGYSVAVTKDVSVLMTNGLRLSGRVRVYCAAGHDRLSDFTREPEQFRYLEAADATRIINMRHVVELKEASDER